MKTIKLISILSFFSLVQLLGFAQAPSLPSVESVFKQYQATNQYVAKSLKEKYLIANPATCKFEMQSNASSSQTSEWNVFKSSQGYKLNWYWPEDRAIVTFKVTTPANKEGVSYVMPLTVEYSRIKSGVLQNEWNYYSWSFGNPWQVKGGKEDALFQELLVSNLLELKGSLDPNDREMDIQYLAPFTSVTSIEKSTRPQQRESYSDKENVIQQYILTGETIEYAPQVYEEANVKDNYTNSKGYIEVVFERSVDKTKRGEWSFAGFNGGPGNKIEHGTPTGDKKLYKTAGAFGFSEIYKKDKQETETPYFTDTYVEEYEKRISEAFTNLFLGKEGAQDELKKYIVGGGDDILKAFVDRANELKNKFVELKPGDDHSGIYVSVSSISYGKVAERGKLTFDIKGVRRKYGKDKTLKNKYKAAMSKEAFSYFEGSFDYSETIYLKLVEFDGDILINEVPEFNAEIKF